jgi:TolB protein
MTKLLLTAAATIFAGAVFAQAVVDIKGAGVAKKSVAVTVSDAEFAKCLKKNLDLSGIFSVQKTASITVSGTPGVAVRVSGDGKILTSTEAVSDAKSRRMAARRLVDRMCETYGAQKGFACDRIAFVNRKGSDNAELCMTYPDGYDIRQLTSDAKATVGPRWKTPDTLFYTGFLNAGPQVYELDVETGRRRRPWSFRGLATGAAVSPDGTKVAIILSFQGNPELYVLQGGRYVRLTNTPNATEGQPSWSPDGRKIVYVSDETRQPQLYIVDVATRAKRRLTAKGSQNVDPDWGADGRIAYITKRGGARVAVLNPAEGEGSVRFVTEPGTWEHPSWSRNRRHLVASRDKALFLVDTQEDGDKPRQLFRANGNWITPSWSR